MVVSLFLCLLVCADDMVQVDTEALCLEDRLRSLGLLSNADDLTSYFTNTSVTFKGIELEADMPQRKVCLISIFICLVYGWEL